MFTLQDETTRQENNLISLKEKKEKRKENKEKKKKKERKRNCLPLATGRRSNIKKTSKSKHPTMQPCNTATFFVNN